MKELEHRMYGLVPYNISPIQQGIQYGHALQEFNNERLLGGNAKEIASFNKWRKMDKTFIILNGGTTNTNQESLGTLNKHLFTLEEAGVDLATFYEPDLGDQLTAIVFLLDERVFDNYKYPPFKQWLGEYVSLDRIKAEKKKYPFSDLHGLFDVEYEIWLDIIGGKKNEFLKDYIKQFRLA